MKQSDAFNYSRIVGNGLVKYATAGALGRNLMGRTQFMPGRGLMSGIQHIAPEAAAAKTPLSGFAMPKSNIPYNAGDAIGWMGGHGMNAAQGIGKFLTKPRQFPGGQMMKNFGAGLRGGYSDARGFGPHGEPIKTPPPQVAPPNLVPDPENFQAAPPAPAGGAVAKSPAMGNPAPTNNWQRLQGFWNNSSTARKAGLGYGAVVGASLPSNLINNAHYDWQSQHPFMSWAGRTFAGMPEYQQHSLLLPSFLQG